MSPGDAAHILGLAPDTPLDEAERKFLQLQTTLEQKIARAPTTGLQQKYRAALARANEAIAVLRSSPDAHASLPSLRRSPPSASPPPPAPLPEPPAPTSTPPAAPPPAPAPARPASRRRRTITVITVAIIAVAAAAAAFFHSPLWRYRDPVEGPRLREIDALAAELSTRIAAIPLTSAPDYFDYVEEDMSTARETLPPSTYARLFADLQARREKSAPVWAAAPDAPGDRYGSTKLFLATRRGELNTVRTLLDQGADPNLPSYIYNFDAGSAEAPALHEALAQGLRPIVDLLADRGARFDLPCTQYGGAIAAAVVSGQPVLVELARTRGAPTTARALLQAVSRAEPALVAATLQAGLPPTDDPSTAHLNSLPGAEVTIGANALHYLVQDPSNPAALEIARLLVAAGIDPRARRQSPTPVTAVELLERRLATTPPTDSAELARAQALLQFLRSPTTTKR